MVMIQSNRWSNCFSEIVKCIQQNRSFVSQIYYTQQNIDEGLTLEMLIFETLYNIMTQLMQPNYLVKRPTDAAAQFL